MTFFCVYLNKSVDNSVDTGRSTEIRSTKPRFKFNPYKTNEIQQHSSHWNFDTILFLNCECLLVVAATASWYPRKQWLINGSPNLRFWSLILRWRFLFTKSPLFFSLLSLSLSYFLFYHHSSTPFPFYTVVLLFHILSFVPHWVPLV